MVAWRQFVPLSNAQLSSLDLAEVNLACADGLPGAERIDVSGCLQTLDLWAANVQRYTELAFEQFYRTDPAAYNHSQPLFRMICLTTALQRHCGVRYDPTKIGLGSESPFDFDEEFIHGVVQGPGGTCATLPIVYAAVGRRLGYPIRLVRTKRHQFCRWDDPRTGEQLNIEGSGHGVDTYPDEYYRHWPKEVTAEEEKAFGYLQSLTPKQELASFIGRRAFRLRDARRYREAVETFIIAAELDAPYLTYPNCILATLPEWKEYLQTLYPPRFPRQIEVLQRPARRRWPTIPWEIEREIAALHTIEFCLYHPLHVAWWWEPLCRGHPPRRDVPTSITIDYDLLVQH